MRIFFRIFFNCLYFIYKTSFISFEIAKRFVKSKYISLVNIILIRAVVDELIQKDFNLENLTISLEKALNKNSINKVQKDYNDLMNELNKNFSFNNVVKDMLSFYKSN